MVRGVNGLATYAQAARAQGVGRQPAVPQEAPAGAGFGDVMNRALRSVEDQHRSADSALSQLASAEQVDLHGTMIELEKADIALRTMVSVRDKFIAAYEQVMNMSV